MTATRDRMEIRTVQRGTIPIRSAAGIPVKISYEKSCNFSKLLP